MAAGKPRDYASMRLGIRPKSTLLMLQNRDQPPKPLIAKPFGLQKISKPLSSILQNSAHAKDSQHTHTVSDNTRISELLSELERKNNVSVLFAVEAGSREWGIESADSDHDLRFVFVRNDRRSYLSLVRGGIETLDGSSADQQFDWMGFDVAKALKLASVINPSIVEMIFSSTVYKQADDDAFVEPLRAFFMSQKRVAPLAYHYRSMAKANYKSHVEKYERVKIKKYLYVIRPMITVQWLLHNYYNNNKTTATTTRPVKLLENNFNVIMDELKGHMDDELHKTIGELVQKKRTLSKTAEVARIPIVDEWINIMFDDVHGPFAKVKQAKTEPVENLDDIDRIFFSLLKVKLDTNANNN